MDFLRGIAILLVLFRHGDLENLFHRIGWIGVDLFFVLSGFLVSGLLFKEFLKFGSVNIKRFLIRRGFKIYPSFYLFVLVASLWHYNNNHEFYPWKMLLTELLYLQSYFDGIWMHTWSVAVEEHFYFGLSLFAFLSCKYRQLGNRRLIISILVAAFVLTFMMRFALTWEHRYESLFGMKQTHLRMDGIILGVIIAYLYYFTSFFTFFNRYRWLFLLFAITLLIPVFIFEGGSFFMNSIGITMMNMSFGIFVLFAAEGSILVSFPKFPPLNSILKFISFIGVNSYSIYLWHLLSKSFVEGIRMTSETMMVTYVLVALLLGIGLTYLIEKPFLKLRDHFFSNPNIK